MRSSARLPFFGDSAEHPDRPDREVAYETCRRQPLGDLLQLDCGVVLHRRPGFELGNLERSVSGSRTLGEVTARALLAGQVRAPFGVAQGRLCPYVIF